MKVERKLSDFSAEKQKRHENMETKTKICETETETEFFLAKMETEMEQCDLVILNYQSNPPLLPHYTE
jgi:nitrate reductase cytochrome c-type subunit